MAPLLEEDFLKLEAQFSSQVAEVAAIPHYCQPCGKSFANEAQFNNHSRGRKHVDVVKKSQVQKPNGAASRPNTSSSIIAKEADEPVEDMEGIVDEDGDSEWESADEGEDGIPQTACLFCNQESRTIDENLKHMSISHSFFIPDVEVIIHIIDQSMIIIARLVLG